MKRERWLVVADDLTGALDAAGGASAYVGPVPVFLKPPAQWPDTPVVICDMNTRHLQSAEVTKRVQETLRGAHTRGESRLYIKVDSTLRGPIGATVEAALRAWPSRQALVCPAFPAQSRTVVDGILYVHGIPLDQTVFAVDVRAPVHSARVAEAFVASSFPIAHLSLDLVRQDVEAVQGILSRSAGIVVADARTDPDLEILAEAGIRAGFSLFVGSAGLLAALMRRAVQTPPQVTAAPHTAGHTVVVVGSRHPATRAQVARLQQHVPAHVVILDAGEWPFRPGEEETVARHLADEAASLCQRVEVGKIIAVGGDTARAVATALGIGRLDVQGEIEPGIPWTRAILASGRSIVWISKAGGFGDQDILLRLVGRGQE